MFPRNSRRFRPIFKLQNQDFSARTLFPRYLTFRPYPYPRPSKALRVACTKDNFIWSPPMFVELAPASGRVPHYSGGGVSQEHNPLPPPQTSQARGRSHRPYPGRKRGSACVAPIPSRPSHGWPRQRKPHTARPSSTCLRPRWDCVATAAGIYTSGAAGAYEVDGQLPPPPPNDDAEGYLPFRVALEPGAEPSFRGGKTEHDTRENELSQYDQDDRAGREPNTPTVQALAWVTARSPLPDWAA